MPEPTPQRTVARTTKKHSSTITGTTMRERVEPASVLQMRVESLGHSSGNSIRTTVLHGTQHYTAVDMYFSFG